MATTAKSTIGGTESASVRAGRWMYLFFNKDNEEDIRFWRLDEKIREPKEYKVKVDGKTDLSSGGAITAIYIDKVNDKKVDEIHLFYISKAETTTDDDGNTIKKRFLREACLRKASEATPSDWTQSDMTLNQKRFEAYSKSMLCSALSTDALPRVFYNQPGQGGVVSFAECQVVSEGKKDWTSTAFTGLAS